MKKVLLTMVALIATAGAFAQQTNPRTAKVKIDHTAYAQKAPEALSGSTGTMAANLATKDVAVNLSKNKTHKANVAAKSPKQAISSVSELEGYYNWSYRMASGRSANPEEAEGIQNYTATVKAVANADEGTVTFTGMFDEPMTASLNTETGLLTFEPQYGGESDYGHFDMYGLWYNEEEARWYLDSFYANVTEDGNIQFIDDMWIVRYLTDGDYAGYSLNPLWMPSSTMVLLNSDNQAVSYTKPAGALYRGWDKEGYGYYATYLQVAPWENVVFENTSTFPSAAKWHINYIYPDSYGPSYGLYSRYLDVTDQADEDGNFTIRLDPGYYYAAPTIVNAAATDSFAISVNYNNNYDFGDNSYRFPEVCYADSIVQAGFLDVHGSGYGFGSLSTGYLYGTGDLENTYGHGTCVAVTQAYPAPISPLYIEDIYSWGLYSDSDTPLAEGKELTMTITGYTKLSNGLCVADEDDVIAVLTATADDVKYQSGPNDIAYTQTGVYYISNITFTQKVVDELGIEGVEPVVIDRPFMITVTGWDQEGVNCGFRSYDIHTEDAEMPDVARFIMNYPDYNDGEGTTRYHYYTNETLPIEFSCMFDKVEVLSTLYANGSIEIPNTNVLKVSDDGESSKVDNDEYDIPGVFVETACSWFDEDGYEMYFVDVPDWIYTVDVDASDYDQEGQDYFNYVTVTAEPLPAGVDYREAQVYVTGRGYTSKEPIIIYQGEKQDGITTVSENTHRASARKFNVAGQQVNNDFRGIVIQNGKKSVVR